MGSTSYLASKSEDLGRSPLKSGLYTGVAYIITVALMILPYLLISNVFIAMAVMICSVLIIILIFNFYISVAEDLPFMKRFSEMAAISNGDRRYFIRYGLSDEIFLWHRYLKSQEEIRLA